MAHRAGMTRIPVPLTLADAVFVRDLAARRNSSAAQVLANMVKPEIEKARRRGMPARDAPGDDESHR